MSQLGQLDQSRLFDSKMLPQPLPINNHRYIDKNIHETIDRIQSYEIHQKKLIRIKEELEKNRLKKINGDTSYEHLKSQMNHNKLRSYEFTETEKINEIKRSNQILLEKLLDISKGKRCDVKQENIQIAIPQSKSLNYQVKKREAERIDQENQKIMERIVNQNPSLSSKKMHHDYIEQLRYKKMKEQNKMGMSVEKIIEKKRKMVLEARSTILPLLNTKLNSPGGTEPMGRNNFNIGGSIDAHSQRVIQNSSEIISHTLPIHNEYQSQQHNTSQSAQNSNNRYANKTQLTKLSHTVSPKSQRQRRVIARSELSDYKEKNSQIGQTTSLNNNYHKPNKIMLESITQSSTNPNTKQVKNASIITQQQIYKGNQIL